MEAEICIAVDDPTCKLSLPFPYLILKGHKHGLITTVQNGQVRAYQKPILEILLEVTLQRPG
jgi:hypothetical protein